MAELFDDKVLIDADSNILTKASLIADYITKYSDTLPNLYKLAYFLLKYDNKFFTKVIYGIE